MLCAVCRCADNFGTPKNGSCKEGSSLGDHDAGCKWRRLPVARIIYYADLERAGWNASLFPTHDTPTDSSGTMAAIESMRGAWASLDRGYLTPRCCGC